MSKKAIGFSLNKEVIMNKKVIGFSVLGVITVISIASALFVFSNYSNIGPSGVKSEVENPEVQEDKVVSVKDKVAAIEGVVEPVEVEEKRIVVMTEDQINEAIKEVLKNSVTNTYKRLYVTGGFRKNDASRIEVPKKLESVKGAIVDYAEGDVIGDLLLKINMVAEKSAPRVAGFFMLAIKQLDIKDGQSMRSGFGPSATEYMKSEMYKGIKRAVTPIIEREMLDAKIYNSYEEIMAVYHSIPMEPPVKFDVGEFIVEKTVQGFFNVMAEEETMMRADKSRRGSSQINDLFEPLDKERFGE